MMKLNRLISPAIIYGAMLGLSLAFAVLLFFAYGFLFTLCIFVAYAVAVYAWTLWDDFDRRDYDRY